MNIFYSKKFVKSFEKLPVKLQKKVSEKIKLFVHNRFDDSLNNHALKGAFVGLRSISVTGDLRIIFREEKGYTIVIMLNIGSHSQLYS